MAELPNRHFTHGWKRVVPVVLKNVSVLVTEPVKHIGQQLAFDLDNVFRPINEANLEIERVILSEVTATRMRLRPINMPGLIHALKSSNPMLFIKLGTLSQVGDTVEVLQGKQICAALGTGSDNF